MCPMVLPCRGRLVDLCLEEAVAHFVAALVTYAKNITDASLEAIQRDHDEISKFFEALCSKERVRPCRAALAPPCGSLGSEGPLACAQVVKSTQALEDLKELAASDSVDTFVLSYTSLLQASAQGSLFMLSIGLCVDALTRGPVTCQVAPGITPTLLERIVGARTDLTKADIKEVGTQTCSRHEAFPASP